MVYAGSPSGSHEQVSEIPDYQIRRQEHSKELILPRTPVNHYRFHAPFAPLI